MTLLGRNPVDESRFSTAVVVWQETLQPHVRGAEILQSVCAAYESVGRHYHTLQHLAEMTEILAAQRSALEDFSAAVFACLWHDIVYDAQRGDNEELSIARWQADARTLEIPLEQSERVAAMIAATKKHQPTNDSFDMALFLDADLAILGADRQRYRNYLHAIRREYAHVPENAYREGRIAVLKKFLQRGELYCTETMRSSLQAAAKENLAYEIQLLQKPDLFTGSFTRTAHGRMCWELSESRDTIHEMILPILATDFDLVAAMPVIEGPGQTVGSVSNGAHTLEWGSDDYCGFYIFAATADDDTFLSRVGEHLGNLLHEPRFNMYRVYV